MTGLRFAVLGTPAPQGSKRAFVRGGRAVLVESAKNGVDLWRGDVVRAARGAIVERGGPLAGPVSIEVEFRLPRPKSHYRTGRKAQVLRGTAPTAHAGKPDIDKLLRSTCDALTTAGVWRDDSQIADVVTRKRYADDELPGATITVTEVTE